MKIFHGFFQRTYICIFPNVTIHHWVDFGSILLQLNGKTSYSKCKKKPGLHLRYYVVTHEVWILANCSGHQAPFLGGYFYVHYSTIAN